MKLTNYAIIFPQDSDTYFVFNTLNGEKIAIRQKLEEIRELLENMQLDKILDYDILLKKKFIIQDCEDELAEVNKMREDIINGNNVLALTILPTSTCNAKCLYCYEAFKPVIMDETVIQGLIRFVGKEIKNFDVLNISWFGGEPLVALAVVEKLSRAFSALCVMNKKKMICGMTTNATLLDYDVFCKLVNYQVKTYQITIDGPESIHNRLRPLKNNENSFQLIMTNLRKIRDFYMKDDILIILRCNITKSTENEMEKFIDFLADEFKQDDRFQIDFRYVYDLGGTSVQQIKNELIQDEDRSCYYIHKAYEKGLSMKHLRNNFRPCSGVCYAARKNHMVIDTLGKIYKCTVYFDDEKNHIGHLEPDGTIVIDKEKLIEWIHCVELYKCKECKLYPICMGRCCPSKLIKSGTLSCPVPLMGLADFIDIL